MMRVLVIGSGGREHALAWRLAQSASVTHVISAPGSDALRGVGRCFDVDVTDHGAVGALCDQQGVGLVVIGPEAPLVDGLADSLRALGLPVVGPGAAAAQLEGSKAYAKALMDRCGIPTAAFSVHESLEEALQALSDGEGPIVVKADGLAAGKGVTVAPDRATAELAVRECFEGRFGRAGARVVLEECLEGTELSFIALCDGRRILPLASSQDHKRLGEGDQGPNTGGMGAFSPSPLCDDRLQARILSEVMEPVVQSMAAAGEPFIGFLYAGIMVGSDGTPRVLEFNVRCGDPETQVLMHRFRGDFGRWLLAAARGQLDTVAHETDQVWDSQAAVGVVFASHSYPSGSRKGDVIQGVDNADEAAGGTVFHAGTRAGQEGWETNGGRVLCVSALGIDLQDAAKRAYEAVGKIHFDGMQWRGDIGRQGV